ncbi:MAG: RES family NAD+ phosphorylase [Candidatus Dadabacteria bacterium]|nr:RES family NAD+ phosphorylase [Candidatus Dadabacteria bacterium]
MKPLNVYRIVIDEYAEDAFSGKGAEKFGGRWNSVGSRCVYTAGSESLSILEILVQRKGVAVEGYTLFQLPLNETDIERFDTGRLPKTWRDYPGSEETKEIGDRWLTKSRKLALALPSAVVPRESIYLLNPAHKGFKRVAGKAKPLKFEFDSRLV